MSTSTQHVSPATHSTTGTNQDQDHDREGGSLPACLPASVRSETEHKLFSQLHIRKRPQNTAVEGFTTFFLCYSFTSTKPSTLPDARYWPSGLNRATSGWLLAPACRAGSCRAVPVRAVSCRFGSCRAGSFRKGTDENVVREHTNVSGSFFTAQDRTFVAMLGVRCIVIYPCHGGMYVSAVYACPHQTYVKETTIAGNAI